MADDDPRQRLFEYYTNLGMPVHQAAAMAGAAIAESGGSPTIQETLKSGARGPGYGLFQWTSPERQQGLQTYAAQNKLDPNALTTQAGYSLYELGGPEKFAGGKLAAAKTYPEAVNAGVHYLRPQGYNVNNPQLAHNYAGRHNAGASFVGEAPLPGAPAYVAPGGTAPPPAPPPTTGLLATGPTPPPGYDSPDINIRTGVSDAEIAQWSDTSAADKAYAKANAEAGAAASKAGASLLAQAEKDAAPKPQQEANMQPSLNQPKELAALPNFIFMPQQQEPQFGQQLAQDRLLRKRRPI